MSLASSRKIAFSFLKEHDQSVQWQQLTSALQHEPLEVDEPSNMCIRTTAGVIYASNSVLETRDVIIY